MAVVRGRMLQQPCRETGLRFEEVGPIWFGGVEPAIAWGRLYGSLRGWRLGFACYGTCSMGIFACYSDLTVEV